MGEREGLELFVGVLNDGVGEEGGWGVVVGGREFGLKGVEGGLEMGGLIEV